MSDTELDGLLAGDPRAQAALAAFRASGTPDQSRDNDLQQALDRNLHEALTALDPLASLPRNLEIRLTGPGTNGRLADDALTDILTPLRREFAAATPDRAVGLGLVGFARGSAVLYFAPSEPVLDPDDQEPPGLLAGPDDVDNALAVVTALHTAAETEGDLLRFADSPALVRSFAALADALDKHQLDLDLRWRNRTGTHRDSVLTRRGRDYARTYLLTQEESEDTELAGRVVSLAINGTFGLKPSLRGAVVDIHTDGEQALLDLGLQLGQQVHVRVRRHQTRDRLNAVGSIRHELLGMASEQEPLG